MRKLLNLIIFFLIDRHITLTKVFLTIIKKKQHLQISYNDVVKLSNSSAKSGLI